MPDQTPRALSDFSNPSHVAVEITELRSALTLLSQQNSNAIQAFTASIQAMQAELQHVGRKVEEVTRLQIYQEQHSDGLTRAFTAISELTATMKAGFDTHRNTHESWTEKHVRENQQTHDKVTKFSGAAATLSLLLTVIVGIAMWYADKADSEASRQRAGMGDQIKENTSRIRSIEYYLSQGGAAPDRKYTPK